MTEEKSILSQPQRDRTLAVFDTLLARAELPAPDKEQYRDAQGTLDVARFDAATAEYHDNPLLERVQNIKKESLEIGAGNLTDAKSVYDKRIGDVKTQFVHGVDNGAPDPNAQASQEGVMGSLMQWPPDIMGAVKHMILGLPFVGELIAAFGKMLKSGFSMGFSEAKEELTLERSFDGGTANIGVDQAVFKQHYFDKDFTPVARPENPLAAAAMPPNVPPIVVQPGTGAEQANHENKSPPTMSAGAVTPAPRVH